MSLQLSLDEENEEDDKFPIVISVSEPQKVGDGLQAFVQYKVLTETSLPIFKKKKFSVLRRFSDFLGLHEKLQEKHLHLGRLVPPAPEKSVAGMAKVGDGAVKSWSSIFPPWLHKWFFCIIEPDEFLMLVLSFLIFLHLKKQYGSANKVSTLTFFLRDFGWKFI